MDLLFKRYASPYVLLDSMMDTGRLAEFIFELVGMVNKEKEEKQLWEIYLNRVYDKSYYAFVDDARREARQEQVDFKAAILDSYEILNEFVPDQR